MATEKRLIDLDTIKPIDFPSTEMDGLDVVRYLNTLPTVDAVKVVHGCWIEKPYLLGTTRYCSICGQNYGMPHGVYNYCPNCGAKMDGGIVPNEN